MRVSFVNVCLELRKKQIRTKFLALRNSLDLELLEDYSMKVAFKVQNLPIYKKAQTVMIYLSCGRELATDLLVNLAFKDKKDVVVPVVVDVKSAEMQAIRIFGFKDVTEIVWGIRQPRPDKSRVINKESIDLFIVPGIVFSELGFRVGYGKGFYDKYLQEVSRLKTVGIAYDFQVIKEVPRTKHDLAVGSMVTERRCIKALDV